ncbi:MAG: hypothetical protein EAY75_14825 [Bacteroidetes bacterium]|nr:MAG: hypothetical protein EAY75_14825 [Bacteroidota bacterium]
MPKLTMLPLNWYTMMQNGPIFDDAAPKKAPLNRPLQPVAALSPNFYTANFGWVCKQEWRFEKATKLPLRIRLGSTAHVDYLEGKTLHDR